jgi:CheY-like chemotaxis protein
MDMSMPELDGWALTALLKATPELAHVPIIAVTAHAMREDQKRAREVGCDAYMSKPIDYYKLNEMVQRFLVRTQHRATLG